MSYPAAKAKHEAEPSNTERRSLWCAARDCPNLWSVEVASGRLCSAHAYAPPHHWPAITQQVLEEETDRARANSTRLDAPAAPLSREEKLVKLRALQALFRDKQGTAAKGWAYALMERESRGESITQTQRQMWRAALGPAHTPHHDDSEVSA